MSTNGSHVYEYLGNKSLIFKKTANTILFPSGSEFLICKVSKNVDAKNG